LGEEEGKSATTRRRSSVSSLEDSPSDEFDHAVRDTRDHVEGEERVRAPGSVVDLVVGSRRANLSSRRGVDDEEESGDQAEHQDRDTQDALGGEPARRRKLVRYETKRAKGSLLTS